MKLHLLGNQMDLGDCKLTKVKACVNWTSYTMDYSHHRWTVCSLVYSFYHQ